MITRYQAKYPERLKAQLYGKDLINALLSSEEVAGIYFNNAIDGNNQERFVLMSSNSKGEMNNNNPGDNGKTCPPFCPAAPYISEVFKK